MRRLDHARNDRRERGERADTLAQSERLAAFDASAHRWRVNPTPAAMARDVLAELHQRRREYAGLRETVAQPWPRCGAEKIDGAAVWLGARFTNDQVVAWLEVGVYTAAAAVRLARAGVEPREVGGEYETDITLGLAFTRGDVSVDGVLRLRRPAREVPC